VVKVNFGNPIHNQTKRQKRKLKILTIVAVAGQIFIMFIYELTGQDEPIDAHRRHGVFYVAERESL